MVGKIPWVSCTLPKFLGRYFAHPTWLQKDWEALVKLEVLYAKQEVNDVKQRSSRPQSGQLV